MKRFWKAFTPVLLALALAVPSLAEVTVTFQVNMSIQEQLNHFDPVNDLIQLRGDFENWTGINMVDNGENIFTADFTFTDDQVGSTQGYKFCIVTDEGDLWESIPNRTLEVPDQDTVLDVVYFNDQDSAGELVDVEVLFQVDMNVQILYGSFNPDVDLIVVRGGHPNLGNWGGETELNPVTGNEGHYSLLVQFDQVEAGTPIEYKFVIIEGGSGGVEHWESNDNRSFTPETDLPDANGNGYGEIILDEVFFSNIGWEDILANDVDVILHVDITPALDSLATGSYTGCDGDITDPDQIQFVAAAGFFNGWPWCDFPPEYQMTSNDGINWEVTISFVAGDPRELIYKYGLNGADNEAGFAVNHSVTIDDSNPTFEVYDLFGSQADAVVPTPRRPVSLELDQNYPNPFNPVTTISFRVDREAPVSLAVFNTLGREVTRLVDRHLSPGVYSVEFAAGDLPSGIYFYRLRSGATTRERKMLLLK